MSDDELRAGADRFSGFAGLYDDVRPTPPPEFGEILRGYVDHQVNVVVDLGSGTGLSSRWAATWADEVIGVEPSDDMRRIAEAHAGPDPDPRIRYVAGWSHDSGLPDGTADVVTVVQALHWMEPASTFAEAARLLRPGGVFAAIDCDFPPVVADVVVERAWDDCRRQMRVFESRLLDGRTGSDLRVPIAVDDADAARYSGIDAHRNRRLLDQVRSWSKSEHLERMVASERFVWCRELAAAADHVGSADRLSGLLRSQGDYQTLCRHGLDDEALGVAEFDRIVTERLGDTAHPWHVVYRARLGFT